MLSIVQKRHPALAAAPDPGRPLPMADRSLEALIAYTGCCRLAAAAQRADVAGAQGSLGAAPMETDRAPAEDVGCDDSSFALLLEHAACRAAPRTLLGAALEASAALAAPGSGFMPSAVAAAVSAAVASPGSGPSGRAAAALLQGVAASVGGPETRARTDAAEDRCAAPSCAARTLWGSRIDAAVLAGKHTARLTMLMSAPSQGCNAPALASRAAVPQRRRRSHRGCAPRRRRCGINAPQRGPGRRRSGPGAAFLATACRLWSG
jgi:hypothetical protein